MGLTEVLVEDVRHDTARPKVDSDVIINALSSVLHRRRVPYNVVSVTGPPPCNPSPFGTSMASSIIIRTYCVMENKIAMLYYNPLSTKLC